MYNLYVYIYIYVYIYLHICHVKTYNSTGSPVQECCQAVTYTKLFRIYKYIYI